MSNEQEYFGKYRGVVTDTKDPLMIGRVRARVPDVMGDKESSWAMPCAPFGGSGMGFFALPKTGAGVWIEFEHGDPDYPIWAGCWWGSVSEMPPTLSSPPPSSKKVMLKTEGGHTILMDDTSGTGGITLEASGGQKIKMTSSGIEIDSGKGPKIKMTSSGIEIDNGKGAAIKLTQGIEIDNGKGATLKMSGSQISVNNGAMEVT